MNKNYFIKYYRVFKNGTSVTEVSTNDFKPLKLSCFKKAKPIGPPVDVLCSIPAIRYSLPADDLMYYGYKDKVHAMEMAKAGALKHIAQLIKNAVESIAALKQYRNEHYEDLNNTLLDANIQRLSKEINIK